MQGTNLFTLRNLFDHCNTNSVETKEGWVPARPLGDTSIPGRIKAAWMVYTGKADVITWPANQ